jgi:4-hydroxybenzoate polyprenyltransferase
VRDVQDGPTVTISAPRPHLRVPHLLWRESRPVVQVVFALRFWVAAAITARHPGSIDVQVLFMGLCCTALSMATYIANGVYDLTEDTANSKARPLARGELSPVVARRAAVTLTAFGLACAAATGSAVLVLIAVTTIGLGWGYSTGAAPMKRSAVGTCVVAVAGGASAYAAGALATGDPVSSGHVVAFGLLSLWMAVGAASKDLGDAVGDRLAGRRTLPVVLGSSRARRAIAAGSLVLGAVAAVAAVSLPAEAAPLAILTAGGLWVAWSCLHTAPAEDGAASRRPYRAFMVTQYAANAALLVHFLA